MIPQDIKQGLVGLVTAAVLGAFSLTIKLQDGPMEPRLLKLAIVALCLGSILGFIGGIYFSEAALSYVKPFGVVDPMAVSAVAGGLSVWVCERLIRRMNKYAKSDGDLK